MGAGSVVGLVSGYSSAVGTLCTTSGSEVLVTMDGYYRNGEVIDHKAKATKRSRPRARRGSRSTRCSSGGGTLGVRLGEVEARQGEAPAVDDAMHVLRGHALCGQPAIKKPLHDAAVRGARLAPVRVVVERDLLPFLGDDVQRAARHAPGLVQREHEILERCLGTEVDRVISRWAAPAVPVLVVDQVHVHALLARREELVAKDPFAGGRPVEVVRSSL